MFGLQVLVFLLTLRMGFHSQVLAPIHLNCHPVAPGHLKLVCKAQ
jgi:hypothetical protein